MHWWKSSSVASLQCLLAWSLIILLSTLCNVTFCSFPSENNGTEVSQNSPVWGWRDKLAESHFKDPKSWESNRLKSLLVHHHVFRYNINIYKLIIAALASLDMSKDVGEQNQQCWDEVTFKGRRRLWDVNRCVTFHLSAPALQLYKHSPVCQ